GPPIWHLMDLLREVARSEGAVYRGVGWLLRDTRRLCLSRALRIRKGRCRPRTSPSWFALELRNVEAGADDVFHNSGSIEDCRVRPPNEPAMPIFGHPIILVLIRELSGPQLVKDRTNLFQFSGQKQVP